MLLEKAAAVHRLALEAAASPHTLRAYAFVHRSFIAYVSAHVDGPPTTAHLTLEHARGWQALLRHKGASLGTVAQYTRVLKIWSAQLVADEILAVNPLAQLKLPRADKHVPSVLTPAQVRLLADLCATTRHPERDRAIILLLADTGIRNDELCSLQVTDVELAAKGQVGRVRVRRGKGGRERYQGLGREASQALRLYLGLGRRSESPWLFVGSRGNQMLPDTLRKLFRLLAERAGIDGTVHVHPHAMRSTYATLQSKAGKNASIIQRELGHANLEQTSRYINLANTDPRDTYTSLVDGWKK